MIAVPPIRYSIVIPFRKATDLTLQTKEKTKMYHFTISVIVYENLWHIHK